VISLPHSAAITREVIDKRLQVSKREKQKKTYLMVHQEMQSGAETTKALSDYAEKKYEQVIELLLPHFFPG